MNLEEARAATKQHSDLIDAIKCRDPAGPAGYSLSMVEVYGEEVCYIWTRWTGYYEDEVVTTKTLEEIFGLG